MSIPVIPPIGPNGAENEFSILPQLEAREPELEILGGVESAVAEMVAELEAKIIDQPEAIQAIAEALDRAPIREVIGMDERPIATFAFLGPTGVGKSETAKALASLMNPYGPTNLIKIDCSSYSHGHEVATLTGSPPGYVGYNLKPLLSAKNVEQPGTVVLFDEIEKGSEPLFNLLLQIMGDGTLTLSRGGQVSFKETIIILTSNVGAGEMAGKLSNLPLGFNQGDQAKGVDRSQLEKVAREAFKAKFKPEFVNRLDEVVVFNPLGSESLGRVLGAKIEELDGLLQDYKGMSLRLSSGTMTHLVQLALREPDMGARPLMRAIDSQILSPLGRYIQSGSLSEGYEVHVSTQAEMRNAGHRVVSESPLLFARRENPELYIKISGGIPNMSPNANTQVMTADGEDGDDDEGDDGE